MNRQHIHRRKFIQQSAGLAASAAVAPYIWTRTSRAAANDRLNVAVDRRGRSRVGHRPPGGPFGRTWWPVPTCISPQRRKRFAGRLRRQMCEVHDRLPPRSWSALTWTPSRAARRTTGTRGSRSTRCEAGKARVLREAADADDGREPADHGQRRQAQTGRVFQVGTQQRSEFDQPCS
jgi:hypothetical protein